MDLPTLALIAFVLQASLGVVFAVSAFPKILNPSAFADSAAGYGILPAAFARPLALTLIPVEALLAFTFLSGWLVTLAAPIALAVLFLFLAAVSINLKRGRRVACGCFGEASEPISRRSLARILLLIGAAGWLVAYRAFVSVRVPTLSSGLRDGSIQDLTAVFGLVVFVLLLGSWLLALPQVVELIRPLNADGMEMGSVGEIGEEIVNA